MDAQERKPYSRREIVIIIIIVIVGAVLIGNFNSTTTTISSVSSGPLSISLNVVCNGFGEPTYYSTLNQDTNYTTYQYGHCYFGFWFSNGENASGSPPNIPTI